MDNSLKKLVNNLSTTELSIDRTSRYTATLCYAKDGSYIIIDDMTMEIVQISNKNDPNWILDSGIINPFYPNN